MKKYLVDFRKVNNINDAHDILKEAFDFPSYYGKNLDALNDCIREKFFNDKVYIIVSKELFIGFSDILSVLEDNNINFEIIVER